MAKQHNLSQKKRFSSRMTDDEDVFRIFIVLMALSTAAAVTGVALVSVL